VLKGIKIKRLLQPEFSNNKDEYKSKSFKDFNSLKYLIPYNTLYIILLANDEVKEL
jgi:hypothetical protein